MHWSRLPALFLTCVLLITYWSPTNPTGRLSAAAALLPADWREPQLEDHPETLPRVVAANHDAAHLAPGWTAAHAISSQELTEQATLETRRPEVQWSAPAATTWEPVATQRTVQVGDRVRTGPAAAARLVYFEGTATDLGPETGILVQRLERSGDGGLLTTLFQAAGTTLSRVAGLVDATARFEIETPSAAALVRGTDVRVSQRPNRGAARRFL